MINARQNQKPPNINLEHYHSIKMISRKLVYKVYTKNQIKLETAYLKKQTSWPEPAKRTIPTERLLLVGKVSVNFSR
jgi:hypothetical protein